MVLATLKRAPSELSSFARKVFKIDDHLGIAASGLASDGRVLCRYMRNECINHRRAMRCLCLAQPALPEWVGSRDIHKPSLYMPWQVTESISCPGLAYCVLALLTCRYCNAQVCLRVTHGGGPTCTPGCGQGPGEDLAHLQFQSVMLLATYESIQEGADNSRA